MGFRREICAAVEKLLRLANRAQIIEKRTLLLLLLLLLLTLSLLLTPLNCKEFKGNL
jgi:hypothetical protein